MANYAHRLPKEAHRGFFYPEPPFVNGSVKLSGKPYTRVRWKCSAFADKTRYIGNVYLTSEGDQDIEKSERFPDSIFKSDVGQLDTFRPYRRLMSASGDGEDIVALAIYADRILEFKENTLYVINIQGDSDFLEDTFRHKGVRGPMAVCTTDFGIAWVNNEGCYLYSGSGGVKNLIERQGHRVIALSSGSRPAQVTGQDWDSFITPQSAIGYSALNRKLFVRRGVGDGAAAANALTNADMYIFDIPSGSWSFHLALTGTDPEYDSSSYFIDTNQDMVFFKENAAGTTLSIGKWDPAPVDQSSFSFWTKNFDFGDPYLRKTIYKISVRYKKGNAMPVVVSADGGETETSVGTLTDSATATWIDLTTNLPMHNVYQLMIGFNQGSAVSPGADFELYEINVIYRTKKVESL